MSTTYAVRIRSRRRARVANESVRVASFRTMAREGRDLLTGAVVHVLAERPPVHWSGAFLAYPFGMPDVPR